VMKIAMIHPSLWGRGGAERQLLRLAIELQNFGHEVEIFTDAVNEQCYPELLRKLTVNVVPHPLWRLHRGLGWQATSSMIRREPAEKKSISRVQRIMKKLVLRQYYVNELPIMLNLGRNIPKGFDVINNHNFPSEWAAFIAKNHLKVPIVWMCNGPPSWFLSEKSRGLKGRLYWPLFELFDKTAVDYIDRIAVISHMSADDVRKAYNKSSQIVRSGVDVDFFHNASGGRFRKKHRLENSFVLLQVGNIGLVRGNIDAVQILSRLSRRRDNVKLVLDGYGSPGQIEALNSLADKLGVKDKLLFLHTESDRELAEVYAGCDMFIYPSKLTWSLAVTEAMAAAKPVIVPKECGVSEIIQNGVNGIVVNNAGAEEVAKQIETLMDDPKLRKKLGENAYGYVKNNLSWEKYAKKMENVFEQTIANFKKNQ
jgi:glycosyltransferase involved in cell wall biosynthesis